MRGDVVIVDLQNINPALKVRPALVIQSDEYNQLLNSTIIAQITGNTSRSFERTQLLIDEKHPDWEQSGLERASVVNAASLFTIQQVRIINTIGSFSLQTMEEVDECLKAALDL
ncbi:MAG: transcriptional modulator of MazE/toxin, MazF [Planctomycetaceae bacterium]|nr:transcriptional modulator of MazE/toxin, MazF [Planctomycetaceae bacterium]